MSASPAPATDRFEGSYLTGGDRISDAAVMECKICWTVYDPAEGDGMRQIAPGTPFRTLPEDWKCPSCDAPKDHFMVREDPGYSAEEDPVEIARVEKLAARLVEEFTDVWHGKMREVPFLNKALAVEAVGFRPWRSAEGWGGGIGVLITPWFMNLVLLPGRHDDWSDLRVGDRERVSFPSGDYDFLHMTAGLMGGVKRCSLFSPMSDFKSQDDARAVAEQILPALLNEENREETDRAATIRAEREKQLAAEAEREAALAEKVAAPTGPKQAKPLGRRDLLLAWRSPSDQPMEDTKDPAE